MRSPFHSSAKATKFLIIDLYSAANQGDVAILKGLIYSLKQEAPHSEFVVHTWFPDLLKQKNNIVVHHSLITHLVGNLSGTLRTVFVCLSLVICSMLVNFKLNISFILPKKYQISFSDFLQADVIVGMGGGFYNDNYWPALPGRLCHLLIGKILCKPVVISAHSFGPFRRSGSQIMSRFVFSQLDAICVRDIASLSILQALKIQTEVIHKVADSAWLLNMSNDDAGRLLKQEQVALSQPLLISLSARRWPYYQDVEHSQGHTNYVNALANALDIIIETYECQIVYLSTCHKDDKEVGLEIKARLRHPDRLVMVSQQYNPSQLKEMYGVMDLHIGTRMHSVILALSAGTPCLGISYEPKLLSMMGEIGLQDYVIDIENVDAAQIVAGIEGILTNRDNFNIVIQREIPRLQKLAQENAKIITRFSHHQSYDQKKY